MDIIILRKEEVAQVIDMKDTIDEVRNVYKLKAQDKTVIWPLVNYEFLDENAAMDIRSGYVKGKQLHGLKMLNNYPDNIKKGLPPFNGLMMVFDSNTGIPIGIMDASYVTCMRTGAAGAIGVDILAKKDAKNLMILGTGKQAAFQIAATLILRPKLEKVYLVNVLNYKNAEEFANNIGGILKNDFGLEELKIEFIAVENVEDAVRDSDAIITVTPSRKPIIKKEWLKPGVHLSCIGSDMETKQEIESKIFEGAKIYTDDKEQCVRVGEIEIPINEGIIRESDITGEIGELLKGDIVGRKNDEEVTVFDATGLYILDLVTAKVAIKRAREVGIGLEIKL